MHCGAQVIFKVVFPVMHTQVVAFICLRCLPKEKSNEPWEVIIHETISFFKPWSVTGTMKHEAKRTFVHEIVEKEINNRKHPE